MLKQTVLFAALFAVALGFIVPEDERSNPPDRPPIDDVTYFDCRGLPEEPQLHLHPWDCTRFIHCHNGRAADVSCAACNETSRCPDGYLHWDGVLINGYQPSCIWPDQSTCKNQQITPTTATPTTTKRSTDDDIITSTTPGSGGGDVCPQNCSQKGWCIDFWQCVGKDRWDEEELIWWGKWTKGVCGKSSSGIQLYWNPAQPSDPTPNPGGKCDLLEKLPAELQKLYLNDPDCLEPCKWEEHDTKVCSGAYYYWNRNNPTDRDLVRQELQCSDGLLFNPATETCDFCENILPPHEAARCTCVPSF